MNNKIESTTTETIKETGSYMDLSFSRAPKKNQDVMVQLNKQIKPWFEKHGGRKEFFQLSNSARA